MEGWIPGTTAVCVCVCVCVCVRAACALCIQTPCFQCPARFVCGRVAWGSSIARDAAVQDIFDLCDRSTSNIFQVVDNMSFRRRFSTQSSGPSSSLPQLRIPGIRRNQHHVDPRTWSPVPCIPGCRRVHHLSVGALLDSHAPPFCGACLAPERIYCMPPAPCAVRRCLVSRTSSWWTASVVLQRKSAVRKSELVAACGFNRPSRRNDRRPPSCPPAVLQG